MQGVIMGTHKKIAAITVMVICLIFISQNSQATGTSTTTTTPAGGNGLDPSFDGDGVAILSGEETDDYFFADIVIQADGKIVAAGGFYNGVYHDGLIARYIMTTVLWTIHSAQMGWSKLTMSSAIKLFMLLPCSLTVK